MAKLAVVFVHGIGIESPDWAKDSIATLQAAVLKQAQDLLKAQAPASADEIAEIKSVFWADVLNARQKHLEQRLASAQPPLKLSGSFWNKLWTVGKSLFKGFQNNFTTKYVADIIGYLDASAYAQIHGRLGQVVDGFAAPTGKAPLTIVCHSLGTVVTSNYLYDLRKKREALQKTGFHENVRLDNFFTLGSPIALFSLRYGGPDAFGDPVKMELPAGRWVNIFDEDDPVGMPLKPLNTAYDKEVLKDVSVQSGGYLISHMSYFKSDAVKIIARKLVLDWAALNNKLTPAELAAFSVEYDKTLGL
jgi:pimeloyl-ACP methyl ester carboxylesterase